MRPAYKAVVSYPIDIGGFKSNIRGMQGFMGRFSMRIKPSRRFFRPLFLVLIVGVVSWLAHNHRMRKGEHLISRSETRELTVVLDER
ncbi:MAG: hypothetical protein ACTJLK_02225 [Anaplasma sp.]